MTGPVKLPFYARLAVTLLAVVLVCFILEQASSIFIPLVFGLLIAILLYPMNKFLEQKLHFGRLWAAITCVTAFLVTMIGFVYFLTLQIIMFSEDFPLLKTRFTQMFDDLQHWLSYRLHITSNQQSVYINKSVNSIIDSAANSVSNIFVSVSGAIVLLIFTVIFTFFILYHRKQLIRFVLHLFSIPNRVKVHEVITETKNMMRAYVQGLVIEMVLVGVVMSVAFLVLGVKYALLLGVMTALLNVIPYLGIYTSLLLCMLVTFANSSVNHALAVGAVIFVIHLLDANILFPRIIGGRMKMNPFITIIAVILGEFLWGVSGMFLFIPVVGIIKLVCERVEGLEAWSILMSVESSDKPSKKVSPVKD